MNQETPNNSKYEAPAVKDLWKWIPKILPNWDIITDIDSIDPSFAWEIYETLNSDKE